LPSMFRITGYKGKYPGSVLMDINRDRLSLFRKMAQEGDMVHFTPLRKKIILLNHPELVAEFASKYSCFARGLTLKRFKFLLGNGLITSEGEFHNQQRKLVAPAFHSNRITDYAQIMIDQAYKWSNSLKPGATIDIQHEMTNLTLNIITTALFGITSISEQDYINESLAFLIHYEATAVKPISGLLQKLKIAPALRKFRIRRGLDRILYRLISERKNNGAETHSDILSKLLTSTDKETGAGMHDRQVRDEAMTIFSAGHETSANALTWAWYLLSQHEEIATRLQQEIHAVVGNRPIEPTDLPQLQYARQIFLEAMRLYPPVWGMIREATAPVSLGGHPVKKDEAVIYSPYLAHHDSRFWIDPERFDPERFSPEARQQRHKYAFIPFGVGGRYCIGEPFAMAEGVLLLAIIAHSWKFRYLSEQPVDFELAITLRPRHSLPMRVERSTS
jgi:cytochrome P450